MGAFFNGRCYGSQGSALDAYYGGAPVAHSGGAISHESFFQQSSGVWQWVTKHNDAGVITGDVVTAPVVDFPVCDPFEAMNDGLIVGWGLVLVMLVGWSFVVIRGQIR